MSLQSRVFAVATLAASMVAFSQELAAHCDTLSGPVVTAARAALETNNVTPLLKWVKATEEAEVRNAFLRTMKVRGLSPDAGELADRFFFETVVRLHRLGEGEPFTGLRDDIELDAVVVNADKALETGAIETVVQLVTDRAAAGVRARFARVRELHEHADTSLGAGRRYVEAYVDFIHYVETLSTYDSAPSQSAVRR